MIYLGSPYSHEDPKVVEERWNATVLATAKFLNWGNMIYSPIVHCHPLAIAHTLPTDAQFWNHYNFHMLSLADELWVLMLNRWEDSKGLQSEIEWATLMGKKIEFISPTLILMENNSETHRG